MSSVQVNEISPAPGVELLLKGQVHFENPPTGLPGGIGGEGEPGAPGEDGIDGKNAFTQLTASFVQPAAAGSVVVSVADSSFMVEGQPLYVAVGGTYVVNSIPSPTSVNLVNLGYPSNLSAGATVPSGGKVSAGGVRGEQGDPGEPGGGVVVSAETSVSVTTTATAGSADYAVFPDSPCTELWIENTVGAGLEYRRNGAGEPFPIFPGQLRRIVGITNANQIGIRRVDHATPVIARATAVVARAITSTEVFGFAGALSLNITNGGANTQLGALPCTAAEIFNPTGKIIKWRIGTTAAYQNLRHGESVVAHGITNANQLYFQCYDFVANILRPLAVECFTSGLVTPLNRASQARMIAPDARVHLDDFMNVTQLGLDRLFLSVLETGDQKTTLIPKNVTPLAHFPTVASIVTDQAGACADSTAGEFLFGTTAVEYTQPGANTIATFAPSGVLPVGVDVTDSDIHFEYSFPDNAGVNFSSSNLSSFAVELYSAGTPAAPGGNYHSVSIGSSAATFMKVDSRRGGTIVSFSVPIANFAGVGAGATLTAITWARFRIQGSSGAAGAKFRPYSIKAIKKARSKAAVVFLFDDLHIGQYTNAAPILAKYNYPACIGVDTVVKMGVTNFMTPQQLVNLHQKHGWQMVGQVQGGNGFGTTVDTGISAEHAITQAARFKGAMKALGISNTQDFSRGSTSFHNANGITGLFFDNWPTLKRVARTSFEFNGGNNANPPMSIGETVPFGDPYAIRRLSMSGYTAGTLLQRWQDQTAYAIANKGVVVWGAHSEFNAAGEALTAFADYVEYLRTEELADNVEVLTVDQLVRSAY